MSYANNMEDELGGLDIVRVLALQQPALAWLPLTATDLKIAMFLQNELPEELREEVRQEKKSQGGYR